MSVREAALVLLKAHAYKIRDARHGTLYRFRASNETLLVRNDHSMGRYDENAWKNVLRDINRILKVKEEAPMAAPKENTVVAPNYPGNGAGPKLGLTVADEDQEDRPRGAHEHAPARSSPDQVDARARGRAGPGRHQAHREGRLRRRRVDDLAGSDRGMSAPLDLEAIKSRVSKAPPGPWTRQDEIIYSRTPLGVLAVRRERIDAPVARFVATVGYNRQDTAEFIAEARTDVPALVAEVERLQTDLQKTIAAWAVAADENEIRGAALEVAERDLALISALKGHPNEKLSNVGQVATKTLERIDAILKNTHRSQKANPPAPSPSEGRGPT